MLSYVKEYFVVKGDMNVKNKSLKMILAAAVTIIVALGIFLTVRFVGGNEPQPQVNTTSENTEASTEARAPKTLKMLSVGDNLIHNGIYEQAQARAGGNGYDFSFAYKNVASAIKEADIATLNQETVIAEGYKPSSYPMFNSPKELGDEMVKIGFDVVNLATNHMLDKTTKGLIQAMDYWDTKEGVVRTGAYRNEEELNKVEFIEKDGLKIGLVGVTQHTNGIKLPTDTAVKIIYTDNEEAIKAKIEAAKKECDVVLVNAHWGEEYTNVPTDLQRNLAKKMADWGADVIIGHHPHVIQPVEWIEKDDGSRTLVAYSLGNFISQQNRAPRMIGGMLRYDLTKDFASGKVTISNVSFETIVTHFVNNKHDIQIYRLSQYNDTLAKAQASRLKQSDFSMKYINDYVNRVIDSEFLK